MSEDGVRGRCVFWMQIGFMREQAVVDTDLSLPALKEMACQFVDRKRIVVVVFAGPHSPAHDGANLAQNPRGVWMAVQEKE
ncbi:hypothetical protein ACOMHN_049400 [Nucella lapillus]